MIKTDRTYRTKQDNEMKVITEKPLSMHCSLEYVTLKGVAYGH